MASSRLRQMMEKMAKSGRTRFVINKDAAVVPPDVYNMDRQPVRGKCVIINNMKFKNKNGKYVFIEESFDEDRDIAQVWQQLHFQIEENVHRDVKKQELKEILAAAVSDANEEAEKGNPYDAFVCYILAHGDESGILVMADGLIDDLKKDEATTDSIDSEAGDVNLYTDILPLFDNDSCHGLRDRPKLFFIQSCRGNEADGLVVASGYDGSESGAGQKLPASSDFLVCFSTSEKLKAKPGYFIPAQMEALRDYAGSEDLMSIMQITRKLMIETYVKKYSKSHQATGVESKKTEGKKILMQCSEDSSTLSKKFMFNESLSSTRKTNPYVYQLDREPSKGLCFVINNLKPAKKGGIKCVGSQKDTEDISDVWTQLGFEVKPYETLTVQQLRRKIEKAVLTANNAACSDDQNPHHAFVCYIMTKSRGAGKMIMADDNDLIVDDLLEMFNNKSCPGLRNQPKLFFIQLYKGEGYVAASGPKKGDYDGTTVMPISSDIFLCQAGKEECEVNPEEDNGSFFIQSNMEALCQYAKTENLTAIMQITRNLVLKKYQQKQADDPEVNFKLPEDRSTLTKCLRFHV